MATLSRPAPVEQSDEASYSSPLPARLPTEQVRISMGRVIAAWGFGAAFTNLTAGAVYTAFVKELGTNNTIFGLLASALPLMGFLQVISAYLVERTRRRKRQMLIAGVASRLLWVVVPLLPLISMALPQLLPKKSVLPLVIACILLSGVFQAFSSPAFFSWMTDLVPARLRPAFFARRMQVGTSVAVLTSLLGGILADLYPYLWVYCVILTLAGIAGVLDNLYFIGVREPQSPAVAAAFDDLAQAVPSPWASIREPLRDPVVRNFVAYVALLWCGYGIYGPFLWRHSMSFLNMSKTMTGLVLHIAPLIALALTTRFWGNTIRDHGNRPVIRLCTLGMALIPLGWITATTDSWWFMAILVFASGSLAGALELANTNLITNLAPDVPRSTITALYSIASGTSYAIASVGGGQIADWFKNLNWEVGNLVFINYHILFFLAIFVRLMTALLVAPRLHEPESSGTRDTLRAVMPDFVGTVTARFVRPFGPRND